jgi:hypothetical protein
MIDVDCTGSKIDAQINKCCIVKMIQTPQKKSIRRRPKGLPQVRIYCQLFTL